MCAYSTSVFDECVDGRDYDGMHKPAQFQTRQKSEHGEEEVAESLTPTQSLFAIDTSWEGDNQVSRKELN